MTNFTRTSCEQVLRALDDLVDGELPAERAAEVEAHLAVCAACLHAYEFEQSVVRSVRGKLQDVVVRTGLRDRVSAEIRKLIEE